MFQITPSTISDIIKVMTYENKPITPKIALDIKKIAIAGNIDNAISKYLFRPVNHSMQINIIEPKNGTSENSHCFFVIKNPFFGLLTIPAERVEESART